MVMIGDEGQAMRVKEDLRGGQAMESLGTGVTGGLLPSLLLCWRGGLAGETGGGNFNYLLFYLFYYG